MPATDINKYNLLNVILKNLIKFQIDQIYAYNDFSENRHFQIKMIYDKIIKLVLEKYSASSKYCRMEIETIRL